VACVAADVASIPRKCSNPIPVQKASTLCSITTILCLLIFSTAVAAQQPMPFLGRGDNPPASPVDVHVTAYLDRLLNVDDKDYTFQVDGPQQSK